MYKETLVDGFHLEIFITRRYVIAANKKIALGLSTYCGREINDTEEIKLTYH